MFLFIEETVMISASISENGSEIEKNAKILYKLQCIDLRCYIIKKIDVLPDITVSGQYL